MDELFTTTELKSFGNYLLSRERSEVIFNSTGDGDFLQMLTKVYPSDFENWKAKFGEAGVAIPQTYIADTYLVPNSEEEEAIRQRVAEEYAEHRKASVARFEWSTPQPEEPRTVVLIL